MLKKFKSNQSTFRSLKDIYEPSSSWLSETSVFILHLHVLIPPLPEIKGFFFYRCIVNQQGHSTA